MGLPMKKITFTALFLCCNNLIDEIALHSHWTSSSHPTRLVKGYTLWIIMHGHLIMYTHQRCHSFIPLPICWYTSTCRMMMRWFSGCTMLEGIELWKKFCVALPFIKVDNIMYNKSEWENTHKRHQQRKTFSPFTVVAVDAFCCFRLHHFVFFFLSVYWMNAVEIEVVSS